TSTRPCFPTFSPGGFSGGALAPLLPFIQADNIATRAVAGDVMRTFRDAAGVEWTVFEVRRTNEESNWAYLPRGFRSGWLCFESSIGKRRLSPVPDGWRALDEEGLVRIMKRATPVGSRASREASFDDRPESPDSL